MRHRRRDIVDCVWCADTDPRSMEVSLVDNDVCVVCVLRERNSRGGLSRGDKKKHTQLRERERGIWMDRIDEARSFVK